MLESFKNIFRIPELRRKILVTFALLIAYRIGRWVTLPGVNSTVIDELIGTSSGGIGDVLELASALTGGSLRQCTLFALGIMPYISASIIFSLLVKVVPALEALSKEGEGGKRKITQYTRYATVGLCLVQSLFILFWMRQPVNGKYLAYVLDPSVEVSWFASSFFWFQTVLALTTGTIILMWIGEQITEFGIGNGISLIIMAGIVEDFPSALGQLTKNITLAHQIGENVPLQAMKLLAFLLLFCAIVVCVVIMQQGQRRIPIQQQKHTRGRKVYGGQRHYLPLRINSAGVMPVIFAESLIIIPTAVLSVAGLSWLSDVLTRGDGFFFIVMYLGLVGFFTYFWTSLTFNPVEMANNMKEYGSFIPGIRPGRRTADYLEQLMNRITLAGSLFLGFVALFPILVTSFLGITGAITYLLGGTGILIVVGVALDIVQKVESHLLMRHYEGFMKGGKVRGRRGF